MSYDTDQFDQDDDDDLANERDLLASLIEKLKCEIDDSKNQMKKELFAHQETISIMSQQKEAQIKFHKTREDKEIDKVIALENKVKQCKEKLKNDKFFKENQSKEFCKEREQYFEIQDLKAQSQDKGIAIITAHILPPNKKLILKKTNVLAPGMYKLHTKPTQTRTTQLPHNFRKTNKRVSFSTRVIPPTSVSRPQLKSNQIEDRVMLNNSQGKKQEVKDHRRNVTFSKNKTSITACNDSLNAKTLNVNFVCVTCGKCVLNDKHDMYVLHSFNGMNSRTKMPMAVPIRTREPKRIVNQFVAKPLKRTVASEFTNQKPRNTTRKLYKHVTKTCSWWYPKFTPHGYKWKPKSQIGNVNPKPIEIILFIVDSGCSKHMTRNLKLLANFVEKFLGTMKFRNDQIAPILGYGDLTTCYIRDLKGNDLLIGSCEIDLYSITLQDTSSPNPICLMAKATSSQAWLWHRYLSHLNFNTINLLSKNDIGIGLPKLKFVKDHLCSSCELGKAKPKSFQTKTAPCSKRWLQLLHMDLCGPMRVESINGKNLFSLVQRRLHAQVRIVQTDKGMEFLNKTLHVYFAAEWINHQMSVARTPEQNGVVKRWNRTLVEATRTILSATKVPLDSTQSIAYRVFNKKTRVIVETIHVNFDELPQMALDHVSSDPVPQCPMTVLEHDSLSPGLQCQENVPQAVGTISTSNELDLLLSLMFDELLNGSTQVVSKSSAVTSADACYQSQQQH
nr:hypothetical protein [Tanacetum cinerariifolium]